jgi:sterol 3beta-glucosyltransferase
MSSDDPEAMTEIACEALARNHRRGVLLTGWGAFHQGCLPEHVCAVSSVPHDWLFSRVSAVIHHGGAGTTGASLRAGVPTGVVSFLPEQSFWGERVWLLGAGPHSLLRRQLTVDRLARMINQLASTEKLRRRAEQLGQKLRAEQGVTNAVYLFQRFIAKPLEKRYSFE